MAMVWGARVAVWVQLLLGFDRFSRGGPGVTRELHLGMGIVVAVLCFLAFRPVEGLASPGPRVLARFLALAPLAIGLYFRFVGPIYSPLVVVHVLLAFATAACVEIAAARQKRGMAAEERVNIVRTDPPA